MIARIELQSNKAKGKVTKISYHVSGPFRILKFTYQSSYIVQRYGEPLSPEVIYIAEDLYLLPSKSLSCELVDGIDARCLNLSHYPIITPLKKILDIRLCNDTFYSSTPPTVLPKFNYSNKTLAFPEHSGILDYPSK